MNVVCAAYALRVLAIVCAGDKTDPRFVGVGEWVDFSFTRKSRQKLLGLLRQEKYRLIHSTKSIDLDGAAHTGLVSYALRHQLTLSEAVVKLLERLFVSPSNEEEGRL